VRLTGLEAREDPFGTAALFADVVAMREGEPHSTTAQVMAPGHAFRVDSSDLLKFLEGNPGVLLQLLGTTFTE
jgi:CRP-like cAMP-binding protein